MTDLSISSSPTDSTTVPVSEPVAVGAIAGALCIGAAALLSLGILPILLGGLVAAGHLTQVGVGQAAMLETFFLAIGAAFGAFWMGDGAIRVKVGMAALALAAFDVATAHSATTTMVLVDRTFAGLFAGLLLGAANTIIVRAKNPGRLSGMLLGLGLLPQIALGYLVPIYLAPAFGPAGGFYALAAGVLIAGFGVLGLPAALQLFIPTRMAGILLAIYFQWLPHHPFDSTARYLNTRIALWPGASAMTLGQSYHLMHHLWPGVPFYNYGRLYRRLRPTVLAKGSRVEGLLVGAYANDRSAT